MLLPAHPASVPAGRALHDARLALVHARDPEADGLFWYSVVTTGVYCRPSCPSRRALPEHIRFHESLDEARRTGFRPCRRCRPEGASEHERRSALVAKVCELIEAQRPAPSSQDLADAVGLSRSQFHRVFRRVTGLTPAAYARGRSVQAGSARRSRGGGGPILSPREGSTASLN